MVKSNRQNRKSDRKKSNEVPGNRKEKIIHEESKAQSTKKEDSKMSANQNTSFVAVETIKCELDRKTTEQEIQERAESIKNVGLIHSVKIQPVEDKTFKYQVVAGRKSFLALTTILNKKQLVIGGESPELTLIDGDADLIAFAENHERVNLTLWEEVEKLEKLREKFKTIGDLANALGKKPKWVARRINLSNLTSEWKNIMKNNEFGSFSIGHYEVVATYPQEIQNSIANYCANYEEVQEASIKKFEKLIQKRFSSKLVNLPWNGDGAEQGCGKCKACLDRINNGFLFENMNDPKEAICMNQKYLQTKLFDFIIAEAEKIRQQEEKIYLISNSWMLDEEDSPFSSEEVLTSQQWCRKSKKDGGVKAFMVDGAEAGRYVYIEVYHDDSNNSEDTQPEEKHVRSLDERKALKNRQRQRKAVESLMEYIKSMDYKIPCRDDIFALIACLKVDNVFSTHYDFDKGEYTRKYDCENGIASFELAKAFEKLDTAVWEALSVEIVRELNYGQSGPGDARWNEAEIISSLISFDLAKAFEDATEALPDPKCWKKLEEQEKQQAA
jgi:ParB/RepB/Spo0J family partition protein